jgi:hypothetical protein
MTTCTFRIATFVNDVGLYAGMRASFEGAGFTRPVARYTVEEGEPYGAISRLGEAAEPYVVLVHQDVRCDLGDTATTLEQILEDLTLTDSNWAVAGNAGGEGRDFVLHLNEHNGRWRARNLPTAVQSLDENLLILRTARRPRCTPGLSGFHLYGTDVCLNAAKEGSTCYVIPFLVTHLSNNSRLAGLNEAKNLLAGHWSSTKPRYLRVSTGTLALARPRVLRWLMMRERVKRRLYGWSISPNVQREPPPHRQH